MLLPVKIEQLTREFMVHKAMNNHRKYDIFHPSAWGSCLRKVAFQYYNEFEKFYQKSDNDVDIRLERVFDNGHGIHARWQNYLDCAGVLRGFWKCSNPMCEMVFGEEHAPWGIFNPQRTIKDWACPGCGNTKKLIYEETLVKSEDIYNFEGHCDAIVDLRSSPYASNDLTDVLVVDFKSMKEELFQELVKAKHEHVIQVHIYMWVLNIHAAVVVYENKNNQAIKEIFVPRDEAVIEKIKEEAIWLRNVINERKLPPKPDGFSMSKFPCRGCEFAKQCWR